MVQLISIGPIRSSELRNRCSYLAITSIVLFAIIIEKINCQTQLNEPDCAQTRRLLATHQQQQQHRQQRQYNNYRTPQQQPSSNQFGYNQRLVKEASNVEQRSPEIEQEEFSLALGNQNSNSNLNLNPTQGQQSNSSYSILELDNQSSTSTGSITTTTSSIPMTTTTTTTDTANTTPSQPSDSIGSPVALQPPVTTTSSIQSGTFNKVTSAPNTSQSTEVQNNATSDPLSTIKASAAQPIMGDFGGQHHSQRHNLGRRIDDNEEAIDQSARSFGRHLMSSGPQSISSSPSSISIITPLMGSPNAQPVQQQQHITSVVSTSIGDSQQQQQQQQSALMKPIFVLGNPISERDYTNSPYDLHQHNSKDPLTRQAESQASKSSSNLDSSTRQPVESPPQVVSQNSNSNNIKASMAKSLDMSTQTPQYNGQTATNLGDKLEVSMESPLNSNSLPEGTQLNNASSFNLGDRISGPPLIYSDGQLASASPSEQQNGSNSTAQSGHVPRLLGPNPQQTGAVLPNNPRRPSLPPPVNQANAASGFRSSMSASGSLIGQPVQPASAAQQQLGSNLQPPVNLAAAAAPSYYQTSAPYASGNMMTAFASGQTMMNSQTVLGYNKPAYVNQQVVPMQQQPNQALVPTQQQQQVVQTGTATATSYSGRRPLNITRVEHISAECSDDLIRAVIVFNGTFKGIIYSSGYVNDPTCLYVNGTGSTRYEFSIRLNQCGTLGRQELHQPTIPGEARRRDQVMWNTLSIQYNSIIEQEWDEHFRVSCEYGSDFWKTVSFSPFNVETNTGSPVVFTINPPQCQMDVLLGHGMGPKIAVDGPVTVGDPLTLLIHMKSEKAGYDILVKNCVAHNGGKQRMQLIDSNGCVVNERFISPFRGTYNDNDLRHVTLYAYLKAFRFTGSPVLYLECEIHMCQSACPPQMCYWRRLSKRSVNEFDYEYTTNSSNALSTNSNDEPPVISDSLNLFKALQVRHDSENSIRAKQQVRDVYAEDDEASLICYRQAEVFVFLTTVGFLLLLFVTIAITCCLRFRKLVKCQYEHNRLAASCSVSPSLLSISDAISNAGSVLGATFSLDGSSMQSFGRTAQVNNLYSRQRHSVANLKSSKLVQTQQRQQQVSPISTNQGKSQVFQSQTSR